MNISLFVFLLMHMLLLSHKRARLLTLLFVLFESKLFEWLLVDFRQSYCYMGCFCHCRTTANRPWIRRCRITDQSNTTAITKQSAAAQRCCHYIVYHQIWHLQIRQLLHWTQSLMQLNIAATTDQSDNAANGVASSSIWLLHYVVDLWLLRSIAIFWPSC